MIRWAASAWMLVAGVAVGLGCRPQVLAVTALVAGAGHAVAARRLS